MGLFLLMVFFVPLECLGMEFLHKDTVLMADLEDIPNGRLGRTVAVNNSDVFMGAPFQTVNQTSQYGATYQHRINPQRQLDYVRTLDPQAARPSRYGSAIVTDGEVTAVGYASNDGIELYQLEAGNWVLIKLLEQPAIENVTIRSFGEIIDLAGDFLVVGDPSAIVDAEANAGVVMIFGRNVGGANNWGLDTHFLDPDPPLDPKFATAVAISTDLMVVGDEFADRALLYHRSGNSWSYHKELQAVDVEADDSFGISVAAEGDFVAVGALNGNDALEPTNAGSVHVFHRNQGGANNFGQVQQITPSAPEFIDGFGKSLRLRQELLVVGAPGSQQVYIFSRLSGAWTEEQKVLPPEGLNFGNDVQFGIDVDYDHGSLVVGSDRWDDVEVEVGAVFLYEDPGIVLCGHLDGIFCDGYESD